MNENTLKIAAAALIHDIGKFADKELLEVTQQYINDNAGQYLPFYDGRYSHYHAVYSAAFIEKMEQFLPQQFNSPSWGTDDIFINLAAGHHNPETPLQWIIAMADRVSSGWDRDTFEGEDVQKIHWKDFRKTRLLSIFDQISTTEKNKADDTLQSYLYRYPLRPFSPANIFPAIKEEVIPADNSVAKLEYAELFKKFKEDLSNLCHKNENVELWLENFESLLMIYTSCIPAARAGDVVPDVSLYDHARTTAALAVAIYLYHLDSDSLTIDAVKKNDDKKFLLINGDFKGIQDFIFSLFTDSEKFRSKILRGRSFSVSLLSELAADMICRKIGLPFSSIILNAAGKFTIIAPNTGNSLSCVCEVEKKINDWLVKVSYGETVVNISTYAASCKDFTINKFSKLWDRFCQKMEEKKYSGIDMHRYGGPVQGYLDSFINEPGRPAICPICGKRPSIKKAGNYVGAGFYACRMCRDHIFLGTNIVKKETIFIATSDADIGNRENGLFEPIFGEYQVSFDLKDIPELAKSNKLIKHWRLSLFKDDLTRGNSALKLINGYVPQYSVELISDERISALKEGDSKNVENGDTMALGDPVSLNHIAILARTKKNDKYHGIEALGVLKADIDHLGLLMACGLPENRFTLSRLATLSRQVDNYFSVYLPHLLKNAHDFSQTYTVFAGGDDLFLIGPWNRIIQLAGFLHESFAEYVCRNPEIHFSSGISLHKPHTPINTMANEAESLLENSKNSGRDRLTLFSATVKWEDFEKLNAVEIEFEKWLDKGWISKAFFYRFNEFIKMAAAEKQILANDSIHIKDMACTKWRSLLVYAAERNVAGQYKGEKRREIVTRVTGTMAQWLADYKGKLRIPLWKILYNRR